MPDATTVQESYSIGQFRIFGGRVMKQVDSVYRPVIEARDAADISTNGQGLRELEAALQNASVAIRTMQSGVQVMMQPYLQEQQMYLVKRRKTAVH